MSVNSSRVPNPQYELVALNSLKLAYNLYPYTVDKRLQRFSQIFSARFPSLAGWKVGQSCRKIYEYTENRDKKYININVGNGTSSFLIKIFE